MDRTRERGDPELLERAEALAALADQLGLARNGSGRIVLLGGEAGVGKTTLLRRFRREHEHDVRVLWCECVPLFTPRSLGPLLDLSEDVGGQLGALAARDPRPHELVPQLVRELAGALRRSSSSRTRTGRTRPPSTWCDSSGAASSRPARSSS
jgi:predicted ATPase